MIIVTGGAGFIGSNIVKGLNQAGYTDILVVDNLANAEKFRNLVDCDLSDYLDKDEFLGRVQRGAEFGCKVEAVFHCGACTITTEQDGRYMMRNNYAYSRELLEYCSLRKIPFLYASSAAVYGQGPNFREAQEFERPLNLYGYSKLLFDQYVRRKLPHFRSQVVGLRYFNVYGPREHHKGSMASVAYHCNQQLITTGKIRLFSGSDGYLDGEQRRDFVYIDDVVAVNLWFMNHPEKSGIFNVGTGHSRSFNDIARTVIAWHGRGTIEYIPFPEDLQGRYQSFTQADISALRKVGYHGSFRTVERGVKAYLDWLNA